MTGSNVDMAAVLVSRSSLEVGRSSETKCARVAGAKRAPFPMRLDRTPISKVRPQQHSFSMGREHQVNSRVVPFSCLVALTDARLAECASSDMQSLLRSEKSLPPRLMHIHVLGLLQDAHVRYMHTRVNWALAACCYNLLNYLCAFMSWRDALVQDTDGLVGPRLLTGQRYDIVICE